MVQFNLWRGLLSLPIKRHPASNKKGTCRERQVPFSHHLQPNHRANINVSYSKSSSADDNRASPSSTHTSNDNVNP